MVCGAVRSSAMYWLHLLRRFRQGRSARRTAQFTQLGERGVQILRQGGLDADRVVGPRVGEVKGVGVQAEAGEQGAFLVAVAGLIANLELRKIEGFGVAVERIDQQWHLDQGEMDANLVLSAGKRPAADEGYTLETIDDLPFCLGRAALFFADDHLGRYARMRSDRGDDQAAILLGRAAHDGQIFFLDKAVLELLGKMPLGLGSFGQQQYAAGPGVQPMDEKEFLGDAQSVGDRFAQGMPTLAAGDGKQPGGFVDHEELLVLQQNGKSLCVFHSRHCSTEAGPVPISYLGGSGCAVYPYYMCCP